MVEQLTTYEIIVSYSFTTVDLFSIYGEHFTSPEKPPTTLEGFIGNPVAVIKIYNWMYVYVLLYDIFILVYHNSKKDLKWTRINHKMRLLEDVNKIG